jgi:hypothetical protein
MDGERKYQQRGYQESSRENRGHDGGRHDDRPKQQGPRPPIDVTGPRLPRLVQSVTASRCYNCSTPLLPDADFTSKCPKCGVALHCCKQCSYFEPSTRFQCLKPISARIAPKDQANECNLFKPRVTVARDTAGASAPQPTPGSQPREGNPLNAPAPRDASDARAAFDNLFKKL